MLRQLTQRGTSGWTEFPEIVLPVPPEALPGGFTKATATFTLIAFRGRPGPSAREEPMRVFGSLRLGRPDSNGVLWTYSTPVNAELGAAPEQAPAIQVPEIKSLTLRLVTNASRRQVGAGLRVMSGKAAVEEILRDGKPAQAQVKLLDSRGRVVASAAGPLSNFGFG